MFLIEHTFLFALIVYAKGFVITDVNYTSVISNSIHPEEEIDSIDAEDLVPQERFNFIFPGTKWCGAGNIADSYDDLGTQMESDICCREHDNCPDVIPAGETKYNLTNTAYYSRLSCKCDENFRKCLRKVNNKTSSTIGSVYFNVLGTQCYRKDYQVVGCKKYGGWNKSKCIEYDYDLNSMKIYQWFDVPNFCASVY